MFSNCRLLLKLKLLSRLFWLGADLRLQTSGFWSSRLVVLQSHIVTELKVLKSTQLLLVKFYVLQVWLQLQRESSGLKRGGGEGGGGRAPATY